jgi:4-amino-4-deoxy-L-arabinose transferase-like glycosyltransferase
MPGGMARAGGQGGGGPGGGLGGATQVSSALTRLLEQDARRYSWVAATVGSESAAPLQLATGDPVMSIGGFNGTDPAPSLAEFKRLVAEHKIHYFVGENSDSFGGGSGDAAAISSWVKAHFAAKTVGGVTVYDLTRAD